MAARDARKDLALVDCTDATAWDAFLAQVPYATAYHTWAWRELLTDSFPGLTPTYVFLEKAGAPIAACPLFSFSPAPLFTSLWSSIFHMYGGPLIAAGHEADTAAIVSRLADHCRRRAADANAYATLVTPSPLASQTVREQLLACGFHRERRWVTHVLDLERPFADIWRGYHKNTRNAVRKAEKSGVVVDELTNVSDRDTFYRLYSESMRRIGVTPKPKGMVNALFRLPIARFLGARVEGKLVAGLLVLHFNGIAKPWLAGSDSHYHILKINNATHNEAIRYACERGFRLYSFGESDPADKGLLHFKSQWGTRTIDCPTYIDIRGPLRYRTWSALEPLLRKLYGLTERLTGK